MTSSRPYLIQAIYEWIADNGLTPYILVDAEASGAEVPRQYVENGKIILNISERAVSDMHQDKEWIWFSARFGGRQQDITVPVHSVLAIYAKENGKGMVFEQDDGSSPPPPSPPRGGGKGSKPHLQVVK